MLTIVEAARRLGLSPATLRQQIKNGALRAEKHGRDWSITPGEVERYRAEHLRQRATDEDRVTP